MSFRNKTDSIRRIVTALATVVLIAGPGAAFAETYLGASYGWFDGKDTDLEDSTTNGWRAFLGASASGVFGWEVGYGELNDLKGRTLGDIKIKAWDLSLLAGLPVGPLRLFGRLGGVYDTVEVASRSDNDWTYRYGVGVDVGLGKRLGLRFEWDRTPVKSDISDIDVDTASAGIFFRF
ncbi:MAG: porin family protein [Sulfurifustaceae bacterium]